MKSSTNIYQNPTSPALGRIQTAELWFWEALEGIRFGRGPRKSRRSGLGLEFQVVSLKIRNLRLMSLN
jgi:hypothetical protein